MKAFFLTIWYRLTLASGAFFNGMQVLMVSLGATGLAMGEAGNTIILWKGLTLSSALTITGAVGAFVARFNVKDHALLEKKVADGAAQSQAPPQRSIPTTVSSVQPPSRQDTDQ